MTTPQLIKDNFYLIFTFLNVILYAPLLAYKYGKIVVKPGFHRLIQDLALFPITVAVGEDKLQQIRVNLCFYSLLEPEPAIFSYSRSLTPRSYKILVVLWDQKHCCFEA